MRPPICAVCGASFLPGGSGDLVSFALRPEDREWLQRAESEGFTGHPPNDEWFCDRHLDAARQLAELTIDVARERLCIR